LHENQGEGWQAAMHPYASFTLRCRCPGLLLSRAKVIVCEHAVGDPCGDGLRVGIRIALPRADAVTSGYRR
jgi:hypothetical protein